MVTRPLNTLSAIFLVAISVSEVAAFQPTSILASRYQSRRKGQCHCVFSNTLGTRGATKGVNIQGMKFSPIGVGTWSWGNQFLWGYTEKDDEELQKVFEYVLAKGVNWFDTADSYGTGRLEGRSEKLLAKFVREHNYRQGPVRSPQDVHIATKLAPYPFRIGQASMTRAIDESLARLQMPQLGVAQLHWPPPLGWQEEAYWAGLGQAYREGKCRAVGVSNYGPKKLRRAHAALKNQGAPLSLLQVQFSLISTLPLKSGLVGATEELGVQLIGYSPLGLGLLTGRYSETRLPTGPRRLLFKELLPKIRPVLATMEEISRGRKRSYSEIAINWVKTKGALPLVGCKTVKQAEQNLAALSWSLSQAEVDALDTAVRQMKGETIQNIFQSE